MERFLAHAGHVHETATEAASHTLGDWYIALPLFIFTIVAFGALMQLTFRKTFVALTLVDIALLIIGFTTYNISAVVSVLAISLGLAGTLVLTLTSLGSPKVPAKESVSLKEKR
jgi:hypothetical protein